jgi:hypothetical protein
MASLVYSASQNWMLLLKHVILLFHRIPRYFLHLLNSNDNKILHFNKLLQIILSYSMKKIFRLDKM